MELAMAEKTHSDQLGLELFLQRPDSADAKRIPTGRGGEGEQVFPELDGDGDHVHFEMVPMSGDSLLWLTIRRGTSPELAASSLRKIADLIERHGALILTMLQGGEGSFSSNGEMVSGPLRLDYDENGDLIIPT
jgi:hypothetical protein